MQTELEIELRKVAKINELPEEVIQYIFNYQFKFLAESIKTDSTKTVMLPKIGKFSPSKNKLKWINEHTTRINKDRV